MNFQHSGTGHTSQKNRDTAAALKAKVSDRWSNLNLHRDSLQIPTEDMPVNRYPGHKEQRIKTEQKPGNKTPISQRQTQKNQGLEQIIPIPDS